MWAQSFSWRDGPRRESSSREQRSTTERLGECPALFFFPPLRLAVVGTAGRLFSYWSVQSRRIRPTIPPPLPGWICLFCFELSRNDRPSELRLYAASFRIKSTRFLYRIALLALPFSYS